MSIDSSFGAARFGGDGEPLNSRGVIALCGINHRTADIALREQFAIDEERLGGVLERIRRVKGVSEAVVINTCNRVEVISALTDTASLSTPFRQGIADVFSDLSGVRRDSVDECLYSLQGERAVQHVFRTAAGLDSLVVGEPQILGQVKEAYEIATRHGTTSTILHHLFRRAFGVAKAVRTQTRIGHNAVSVAYAARSLAEEIFGDLTGACVLLAGSGDTGQLALKHFAAAGCKRILVASRSVERASALAGAHDGVALGYPQIPAVLHDADVILGATTIERGDAQILRRAHVEEARLRRQGKPQFFIDLGVPRNFDPLIGELPDAFLYTVDDLEGVVKQNRDARTLEIARAESIITDEVEKFSQWLAARELDALVGEVGAKLEELREREVAKTMKRIERTQDPAEQKAALEDLTRALLSKALHRSIEGVKSGDPILVQAFRRFFRDNG